MTILVQHLEKFSHTENGFFLKEIDLFQKKTIYQIIIIEVFWKHLNLFKRIVGFE